MAICADLYALICGCFKSHLVMMAPTYTSLSNRILATFFATVEFKLLTTPVAHSALTISPSSLACANNIQKTNRCSTPPRARIPSRRTELPGKIHRNVDQRFPPHPPDTQMHGGSSPRVPYRR